MPRKQFRELEVFPRIFVCRSAPTQGWFWCERSPLRASIGGRDEHTRVAAGFTRQKGPPQLSGHAWRQVDSMLSPATKHPLAPSEGQLVKYHSGTLARERETGRGTVGKRGDSVTDLA